MCGIIMVIAKNGDRELAREAMLEQYQNQFERGQKGFGLVEVNKEGIRVRRATEPVKALLDVSRSDSDILLFHHRAPTSTENTLKSTHPFYISHPELKFDYYIAHNGTLNNARELKTKHEKLGYVYLTEHKKDSTYIHRLNFNDSEALAIEIARFLEGKQKTVEFEGRAAFIGVKLDKTTKKPVLVLYGRGEGSPLQIFEDDKKLIIASDIPDDDQEIFDVTEKTINVLTLKAIHSPDLWGKKEEMKDPKEAFMPLFDMSFTEDLHIEEKKTTPIIRTPAVGFNTSPTNRSSTTSSSKNHLLLEKGRQGELSSAKELKIQETVEVDETSARFTAFEKMTERVKEYTDAILKSFFKELMTKELGEKEIKEVVTIMENMLKEKCETSKKIRAFMDKMEMKEALENHEIIDEEEDSPYPESMISKTEIVLEGEDKIASAIDRNLRKLDIIT